MSGVKLTGTDPDPNRSDYQGADRDPDITRSIEDGPPTDQDVTNDVTTGKSDQTTLGGVREVYAGDKTAETDVEFDNSAAVEPGHSPNSWSVEDDDGVDRGADPYRNQGLSGPNSDRDYLENQG